MNEDDKTIPVAQVKADAHYVARITRERLLAVPDQIADQLVGKTNVHTIEVILRNALSDALGELSHTYGSKN